MSYHGYHTAFGNPNFFASFPTLNYTNHIASRSNFYFSVSYIVLLLLQLLNVTCPSSCSFSRGLLFQYLQLMVAILVLDRFLLYLVLSNWKLSKSLAVLKDSVVLFKKGLCAEFPGTLTASTGLRDLLVIYYAYICPANEKLGRK